MPALDEIRDEFVQISLRAGLDKSAGSLIFPILPPSSEQDNVPKLWRLPKIGWIRHLEV